MGSGRAVETGLKKVGVQADDSVIEVMSLECYLFATDLIVKRTDVEISTMLILGV
jgi:ethanolamine utilization microcompartment shell protein EutS|tara:strand:- start:522 stop:686 length:165 start_codon:yes stop_codon:yes gene_type:complete